MGHIKVPEYEYSDEWSFKDYHDTSSDIPNGTTVYASQFWSHELDTNPFRADMRDVTFVRCHLDNVIIPEGNTLVECWHRRWKVQNDGNQWEIDKDGKPTVPMMAAKQFLKRGLLVPDPKDIPTEKVSEQVDLIEKQKVIKAALEAQIIP